jgi:hypothetical protein
VNKFAVLVGLTIATAGCSSHSSAPSTDSQDIGARTISNSDEPRSITDLSQISSAKAMPAPIGLKSNPSATKGATTPNATVQQNIERLFVSNPDQLRYHEGRPEAPGETMLLNDKARQFSEFSYKLLNQTLKAAHDIEPDRLTGRRLPEDISPMVLVAVMDSQGRLTEIAIESHSGDRQVDQIIIDSCKQGLWSRNPPVEAVGPDGMYRLRIRGYIRAYSIDRKGQYKYQTELGLGIL